MSAADISRHAFRYLVTVWLSVVLLTFAIALLLFSTTEAKAFDSLSPELVSSRGPSFLPLVPSAGHESYQSTSFQSRRSAGNSNLSRVQTMQALRECQSQQAL